MDLLKVDDAGAHIGGKGYWGHCEKWSYSISCKFGLIFGKIQSYLNNKLGVSGMKITADDQTQFQILPRYFKTNLLINPDQNTPGIILTCV